MTQRGRGVAKHDKSRPIRGRLIKEVGDVLAHDPVCPLPGFALRRVDLQAQLLGNVPADKTANGVVLPGVGMLIRLHITDIVG